MKQKAQMSTSTIFYIMVIIVIIGFSILFGYRAISGVGKTGELAEATIFEKSIKEDIAYMYSSPGSVIEEEYAIPASIEKVYFIDTEKINMPNGGLGEAVIREIFEFTPEIAEEILSKTGNNMFLYKDGKFQKADKAGDISSKFPYFECFEPKSGKINVQLEGAEDGTRLNHKNESRNNCGPQRIEMLAEEVTPVSKGAFSKRDDMGGVITNPIADYLAMQYWLTNNEASVDTNSDVIKGKIDATKDYVEMARITNIVEEDVSPTKVNIIVKAKDRPLQNFIYIENIPKDCIQGGDLSLKTDQFELADLSPTGVSPIMKKDPQMMWEFNTNIPTTSPSNIRYTIQQVLTEDCIAAINGIGFEK